MSQDNLAPSSPAPAQATRPVLAAVEPLARAVDHTFQEFQPWEFQPGPDIPWLTEPSRMSKWSTSVSHSLWMGRWQMFLPLMRRKGVTEIVVFGAEKIVVETDRGVFTTSLNFDTDAPLPPGWPSEHRPNASDLAKGLSIIQREVAGRETWEPGMETRDVLVEAQLEDGSRLEALMPPCSTTSDVVFNIRRFAPVKFTREQFIRMGSFTEQAGDAMEMAVTFGLTTVIGAGTGCGKTTLLEYLLGTIQQDKFILTIEDTPELQVNHPFYRGLRTRERMQGLDPNAPYQEMGPADLLRASLRLRPDWIVVGEIRDAGNNKSVADAFVNACQSGHSGGATVHAETAHEAMIRLESMLRAARPNMKDDALRLNLGETVKLLVILSRETVQTWDEDGTPAIRVLRRVKEIVEVLGSDGHTYHLHTLFGTRYQTREIRTAAGIKEVRWPFLVMEGLPFFGLQMEDRGLPLPDWWHEAKLEFMQKIPKVGRVAHAERLLHF